jgi:hypothetical protein
MSPERGAWNFSTPAAAFSRSAWTFFARPRMPWISISSLLRLRTEPS